jgi:hypothetical protein
MRFQGGSEESPWTQITDAYQVASGEVVLLNMELDVI